jgi:hypothetical protein
MRSSWVHWPRLFCFEVVPQMPSDCAGSVGTSRTMAVIFVPLKVSTPVN